VGPGLQRAGAGKEEVGESIPHRSEPQPGSRVALTEARDHLCHLVAILLCEVDPGNRRLQAHVGLVSILFTVATSVIPRAWSRKYTLV
jgi:hypothetical protein